MLQRAVWEVPQANISFWVHEGSDENTPLFPVIWFVYHLTRQSPRFPVAIGGSPKPLQLQVGPHLRSLPLFGQRSSVAPSAHFKAEDVAYAPCWHLVYPRDMGSMVNSRVGPTNIYKMATALVRASTPLSVKWENHATLVFGLL